MEIDSLVIIEKNHLDEACLFVNPVSPGGEVIVHTDLSDAWLELGPFRVALTPASPLVLAADVGRHPITIQARGRTIPLFVHVDVDGDERVELCVRANDKGHAQATLLSRVARADRDSVTVCFQTTPQGLQTTVHALRHGRMEPDVIALPKGQAFATLRLRREDFPVQVRLDNEVHGEQVGGTEQVDIIVE